MPILSKHSSPRYEKAAPDYAGPRMQGRRVLYTERILNPEVEKAAS